MNRSVHEERRLLRRIKEVPNPTELFRIFDALVRRGNPTHILFSAIDMALNKFEVRRRKALLLLDRVEADVEFLRQESKALFSSRSRHHRESNKRPGKGYK